jgi:hypothetical protein
MRGGVMWKIVLILFCFSFLSCSNSKQNKNIVKDIDSLKSEKKEPKDFKSIQQKEWEEHKKDTLVNNRNDSIQTIIRYKPFKK